MGSLSKDLKHLEPILPSGYRNTEFERFVEKEIMSIMKYFQLHDFYLR